MTMRETTYNSNLAKGCGLIDETLMLLSLYEEGMTKASLADYIHQHNSLSKCTEKRSKDIVNLVFYPRFMKNDSRVPTWLKAIRNRGVMLPQFKQLLMLYCARENAIMYDYIISRLNEYRNSGKNSIKREEIRRYVNDIVTAGKASWSESICNKQVSYIKSVLLDFDLVDKRNNILPYNIANTTVLYLMHELHFRGLSDMAIWYHEDWSLYGLDKYQVQEKIMELNLKGGYIAQCSGELLTISWNYQTMEEFINGAI